MTHQTWCLRTYHLQETWSVNAPPIKGPTTLAMPQVAPNKPPYLPRLCQREYTTRRVDCIIYALLQTDDVRNRDDDQLNDTASA